ncbi:hypothetical protein LA080_002088 [Diaporthe eres]|nr:hypothetical protein LA080_002088 [Diaporthe eres]
MKLNISLLLSLGQLAAAGQTLDVRKDGSETQCYVFDAVDNEHTLAFNTFSACAEECLQSDQFVIAMRESGCFCLDSLPPDDKKVDASECTEPCPGYALNTCGGKPGYYSVGTFDASDFDTSNTTNTTSTSSDTASSTTSATAIASSSNVPSNGTASATPPSSSASGTSGSSASATTTVESSSAAALAFGSSVTVISSLVYAVAAIVAVI